MKATKLIGFLIVVLGIGTGIYFYQKDKEDKALADHNKKKFEQINLAAQKTSAAGVQPMAAAIIKYHQTKGHYPKKLIDLYPDFIPDKTFILTLNWEYSTGKGTFQIKRHVTGQQLYSSMGPDMKLKMFKKGSETSSTAVAASKPRKKPVVAAIAAPKLDLKIPGPLKPVASTVSRSIPKETGKKASVETKPTPKPEPEFVIVKKELGSNELFLSSFDHAGLYIWKTEKGVLGFSNIQYPDEKKLIIYKNQNWIEYQENPSYSGNF